MPDTPDLESRTVPEDHRDLRLWLRMLTCCNLIESEIRGRLRTEYETTLPRFDLMAQLLRTPAGMKMSELSRHMMVTNGNITGITDQLEKEGLVERVKVATDRRSSLIKLTGKGKRSFRKMAQAHEEWVQSIFGGLSEKSRNTLFDALGELKLQIRPQSPNRN
ncbi:MarR family winged helix-turn-helix transcriptional regulator [Pollutimonas sp. M17]|uniref:MarR family winged helix-turn-helix transcriptional regulator n=1 Tax=Pollutimonas sp. M17 TaxID=2962065 RepID=UPI0021F432E5|nr:MarR family transcriptional regulator [Pollutimonas sp. M17]UYO94252.1 MarR family transcriptional regulator [Pollutimonas sp. M17]HWK71219.1 MarR family transcriptional regulator [Burkholderiaceae bacterium]